MPHHRITFGGLVVLLSVTINALKHGAFHAHPNAVHVLSSSKTTTSSSSQHAASSALLPASNTGNSPSNAHPSVSSNTGKSTSTAKSTTSTTTKAQSTNISGSSTTVVQTLQIGSQGSGTLTVISGSSGTPEVYYTGAPISGTAELPPAISSVIFPTQAPSHPFSVASAAGLGTNKLPQTDTNGLSPLGSLSAPKVPQYIGGNTNSTTSFPWGNRTVQGTNPYLNPPNTGITRTYSFVIARSTLAPDGVEREVLLVNDQFPGPTIEANWGDTIEVTVKNSITGPEEGTAIHWHGLLQTNTPYYDGIPGITQCPIAPGETFKYVFNADLYGTSWWHSHYSAQYAGGAFGAMIIHGPNDLDYDEDVGPIMLSDYFHHDYTVMVERTMSVDLDVTTLYSDNNLINGKGNYNCSLITDNTTCTSDAGYSKFKFTSGKTYRLRLINTGAEGIQKFSIDKHVMKVMAYDFVPIEPYNTKIITLGVGQRADVIVTANGSSTDAVWMRSTMTSCALTNQPYGYAIVYYESANTTSQPTSTAWTDTTAACANDALSSTVPLYAIAPGTPETTIAITLDFLINSTGNFLWTMDGSSFRVDYNSPILDLAHSGNYTYSTDWNVYNFGSNTSFRILINNETPQAHPMHIHGHNMYILDEGTGSWDGTIVNGNNTMRRDVQMLQPDGYMVMQIDADNPGVWPFHCHIAWHVSGGLYVNLLERPSDIRNMTMPTILSNTCTKWNEYTNANVVDQIDSGLRK